MSIPILAIHASPARLRRFVRSSLVAGLLGASACGATNGQRPEETADFSKENLLAKDASCHATDERLSWTYTYRAATRALSEAYEPRVAPVGAVSGVFESELDDRGLAKYRQERQNGEIVWHHDYAYDDHGRLSRLVQSSLVIDYTNTYDPATGRLMSVARGGPSPSLVTYTYVDDRLDHFMVDDLTGDALDTTTTLSYDAAGLRTGAEIRRAVDPATVYQRLVLIYDGAGRLTDSLSDGGAPLVGADGTNDSHATWTYREGTDVSHMQLDGTTELDDPVIDGVPDHATDFANGCRAIGALAPRLYDYPSIATAP